jgi:uncharacterized OsmC-like protein
MSEALEVTAMWRGGYATDVRAREHEVRVDEPCEVGGEDSGMMPTELFCAALASCFCLAVAWAAAKRSVEAPDLSVTVRADRAGDELRYDRFVVEARAAMDDAGLARLVRAARPVCWVSNTLAAGVCVEYRHITVDGHFRK